MDDNQNKPEDINIDNLFVKKETTETKPEIKTETTTEENKEDEAPVIDNQTIATIAAQAAQKAVEAVTNINTRDSQVSEFLNSDEGKLYSQYGEQIRRAAKASEYSHLPIGNIVGLVLGTKMVTIGATEEQKAAAEQKGNAGGNGTGANRTVDPNEKVSAWKMDKDTFEQTVADAKAGKFKVAS